MHRMAVLFVAGSVLAMAFPVIAQELPKATKFQDAEYYTARYVKFKPGKEMRALNHNLSNADVAFIADFLRAPGSP